MKPCKLTLNGHVYTVDRDGTIIADGQTDITHTDMGKGVLMEVRRLRANKARRDRHQATTAETCTRFPLQYYTPLTVNEFWNYAATAVSRTVIQDTEQVLQFRNAKGLLTTEKWWFVSPHWLRISVR